MSAQVFHDAFSSCSKLTDVLIETEMLHPFLLFFFPAFQQNIVAFITSYCPQNIISFSRYPIITPKHFAFCSSETYLAIATPSSNNRNC